MPESKKNVAPVFLRHLRSALVPVIAAAAAVIACSSHSDIKPDPSGPKPGGIPSGFSESNVRLPNGIGLHVVRGGTGPSVVLLHGFPQSWYEWRKVMPTLSTRYDVVAMDMRGAGGSDSPADGYDKTTLADDLHQLLGVLGTKKVHVVGHDIGQMVAFFHAALHPEDVSSIALLEAPIPDSSVFTFPALTANGPGIWWFGWFNTAQMPETMLAGHESFFIRQFVTNLGVTPTVMTDDDIAVYAPNLSDASKLHGQLGYYRTFAQDAKAIADGKLRVAAPVLAVGADHSLGAMQGMQAAQYAANVTQKVFPNSTHFIPEEHPDDLAQMLIQFFDANP